ncbi:hypothetical protein B0A52_10153 [Exophiala mesophila]|uniref:CN hydrolase domain-containing protein n=1 Tax=Exophiala mesophila TaxID=212818 RepID=A0A438MRG1_EXOME|nr:hypothetical protein B0A52_10153 [Exophiala mesophila]
MAPAFKVAACHVAPVYLNAAETTKRCVSLINEAADNGAHLVVFPETYIPAFPFWSSVLSPADSHGFFIKMAKESVYADGDELTAVSTVAKERNVYVSLGVSEKVRYSSATLFNSNFIFGPSGDVLVHHRKLQATFFERLTWSMGDGNGLKVVECAPSGPEGPRAKIGALVCGENTNPLARYTLIAQGEQFHISTWPAKWPTKPITSPASAESANPTSKDPTRGEFDNVVLNRTRCASQCVEGKCFGVLCAGFMSPEMIDTLLSMTPASGKGVMKLTMEHSAQAETLFLGPSGAPIPAYTIDSKTGERDEVGVLRHQQGILYADMDMDATIEGKQFHDVVGGYQRFDVFDLKVNLVRRQPVNFVGADSG